MEILRKFKTAGIMIAILALIAAFSVPQANAAEYWKQVHVRFSATAGETLAVGDVVCIAAADGYAYKADANDSSLRPAVGIVNKGASAAAKVEIAVMGILAGQTAASPGYRLFLSETAAALTTTAPTNAQGLGWVMEGATVGGASSTDYFINIQMPMSTGAAY